MKAFFTFLEVSIVLLLLLFIFTQIVLPALRGTALFPWFHKEGTMRTAWAAARQKAREAKLARVVKRAQQRNKE
jgi:hypothetical protein